MTDLTELPVAPPASYTGGIPAGPHFSTGTEFEAFVAALDVAGEDACGRAAVALAEVCRGVLTGEGATTEGRRHFSRTIDAVDARWCARILAAADQPVSRAEAENLFAIDAAGVEREDDGRFAILLVKAVTHHLLADAGVAVPPRRVALAAATRLAGWATPQAIAAVGTDAARWLAARLGRQGRRADGEGMLPVLLGGIAPTPRASSLQELVDRAA